jgi:hypothetical protein
MFTKKIRIVAVLAVIVAFGAVTSSAFAAQVEGPGPGLTDNGSQQATHVPFAVAPHHPEVMGTRNSQVTPGHQIIRPAYYAGRAVPPSAAVLSSDETGFGFTDGLIMAALLAGTFTLIAISAHRPRPRRAVH